MARKSKNTDVVAASPLVATGVEKMIPSEIPNRLKSQFAILNGKGNNPIANALRSQLNW
jgi:hypothetical protein